MLALHHADLEDPILAEPLHRLVDQGQRRHGEDDSLVLAPSHVHDGGGDDGLAAAGGGLHHWPALAGAQGLPQFIDGALLVASEFHCYVPVPRVL